MRENATVSDNTAGSGGGGIFMQYNATFRIEGGIIYGNDGTENQNTAGTGAALFVVSGTVQYGTFNETAFTSLDIDNDIGRDETLKVVNGELIK
jgi:predicted outer membrane repeat protein